MRLFHGSNIKIDFIDLNKAKPPSKILELVFIQQNS
jgi:hypothetical protein